MHKPDILDLFPTPVYTTMIPVELSSVIPFLDIQDMDTKSDETNYGRRSKDSYILSKLECANLSSFILECVQDYGDNTLLYTYENYRLSQSWISHKEPGQQHTMHSHPNSLISGVFYYGASEEYTPAIKFHKTVGSVGQATIMPSVKLDRRTSKFAWTEFSVNFQPGLLVLFPSWLHHSVPQNITDSVRCSLAFNVVPTKGLGDETSLTELLFN
jgi:uncharacterized protein (TIGR02466 family)